MTKCLHQLFEAQVQHTPDAIAVVFEDESLTYSELNRYANQVAFHLQGLAIGPDKLVAICMERSLAMVVGVLGILKAGGAYVPLDPAYPQERLAFMLEDSQAPVLVTHDKVKAKLPAHKTHVVNLVDALPQTTAYGNPIVNVTPDNLAYIIYTSGSTGKPKGVAMPHGPLVNLIDWQNRNSTLSQGAKTLQFSPLSFDVSCQEMFAAWSSGGTLVLITEELRRDATALWHFLAEASIERLFLPFIALQHLAEAADRAMTALPPLREIVTAGEQLQITQPIVNLFRRLKTCTLHNQYGPTESHVVTAYTLVGSPETWDALPPIGRPIANAHIHVLDEDLHPTPVGESGELYIGGHVLARGYLRRPGLTAERFIPDPFSQMPGARLYKTGDLARFRRDEQIEFLGRIDHQVKLRGFRIELGEIEVALARHPAIQEAAVMVREDTPGAPRLVAYMVSPTTPPSVAELRHFLEQTMPDYMLPAAFVFMDTLPLTPSGKINRRALPSLGNDRPALEQAYIAPRNAVEETLAEVWADALELERVGIHDNFFELGGHSLLAARIVAQMRDNLHVELSMHVVFEMQTIAAVAEYLATLQWAVASQQTDAHPQADTVDAREEGEL